MKVFTILRNIVTKAKAYTDTKFGLMGDYVVEQGTSGIWTYRKWNSGIAECWGSTSKTANINSAQGNIFTSSELTETYPSNIFITIQTVHVTKSSYYSNSGIFGTAWDKDNRTVRFSVFRGNSSTNNTVDVSINIKGTWK